MSQQERCGSLGQPVLKDLWIVRRCTHVPEVKDQAAVWGCSTRGSNSALRAGQGRGRRVNPTTTDTCTGVTSTTQTRVRSALCR